MEILAFQCLLSRCEIYEWLVDGIVYMQLKITSNSQDETTIAENDDTTKGFNSIFINYRYIANACCIIAVMRRECRQKRLVLSPKRIMKP